MISRGKCIYDDVSLVPVIHYHAKGDRDPVAAYLNLLMTMPGDVTETGTPPESTPELSYTDCYGPGAAPIPGEPEETQTGTLPSEEPER